MQNASDSIGYSARVFDSILKVARNIATWKNKKISSATISLKLSNTVLWIKNTGANSIKLYNLIT
ncbi:MAG: hypothetical protein PHE75_04475 [Candidatus Cloacimonas acidaminovorans]|jgi:hypothetical protein|nr:hypothetical protein [Candidatus Cloacimonas acidaminovorans]